MEFLSRTILSISHTWLHPESRILFHWNLSPFHLNSPSNFLMSSDGNQKQFNVGNETNLNSIYPELFLYPRMHSINWNPAWYLDYSTDNKYRNLSRNDLKKQAYRWKSKIGIIEFWIEWKKCISNQHETSFFHLY